MLQNLLHFAPLLTAVMTCVTALIWVVYLNFFLRSYRRQQRPSILTGPDGKVVRAVIPERTEHWSKAAPSEDDDIRRATNVGPLSSGGERDLGRFRTLIDRAGTENPDIKTGNAFTSLEITVVIVTASQAELCGASRCYRIEYGDDGAPKLKARTIKAAQLQGYFARRNLTRLLTTQLEGSRR